MKKAILLGAVSAILLAAGAAQAAGPRGHHGHAGGGIMLKAADANGDDAVTQEEAASLQQEMIAWMDRNGDQVLDDADQSPVMQRLKAMRADSEDGDEPRRQRDHEIDANDDGQVTWAEYSAHHQARFAEMDANDDGQVTMEEAKENMPDRRKRFFKRGDR